MKKHQILKLLLMPVSIALLGPSQPAMAFSEDICYNDNVNVDITAVKNCWDMQCKDNNASGACAVHGAELYLKTTLLASPKDPSAARSSLHFDLAWIMARAAGFSAQNATVVASYSAATDKGYYTDYNANPANNYSTVSMSGVERNNLLAGGPWFHFVPRNGNPATAPYSSDGSLNYNPSATLPFGPYELPLTHIRNWAFGSVKTLCNFAITNVDGSCADRGVISVSYAALGPTSLPPINTALGAVQIDQDNTVLNNAFSGTPMGLGIYIHALGDRVSHYKCSDYSFITQDAPAHYVLVYPEGHCGQIEHAMLHYSETGTSPTPARDGIALDYYLSEMTQWLKAHPQYAEHAPLLLPGRGPIDMNQIKARLLQAISEGGAAQRLMGLCNTAHDYGMGWHDGNLACSYHSAY